jgi:mycofactocin precursor
MPDINLQTNEANVILSEAKDLSPLEAPTNVILSEAKDLSPLEALTDVDTLELDLALEDELIIEDFTIDGICGVY